MQGYLRVESGPDQGRIFNILDRTVLVIGRSQKTDTQLKDFSVSRVHCEVRFEDGKVTLLDQEGSSGTFLNGKQVAEQTLKSGDTIRIGETEIKVHLAGISDAETVTAAQKAPRTLQEAAAGGTPEVDLSLYPLIAAVTGMPFLILGSCYWGWCHAFAAAFYALSLLMTYDLRWAPIEFGVVWAVALGTIGLRLRRLAADEA